MTCTLILDIGSHWSLAFLEEMTRSAAGITDPLLRIHCLTHMASCVNKQVPSEVVISLPLIVLYNSCAFIGYNIHKYPGSIPIVNFRMKAVLTH